MNYNSKYRKRLAFAVVIVLLIGSGFYSWHMYQTNKLYEIQISNSVKYTTACMLNELRLIEGKTTEMNALSDEELKNAIRSIDNIYVLSMTLPAPVNYAAEYPLNSIKQVLFEYDVPITERNLKLTDEELQDYIDLQLNQAYEIIDIVSTEQNEFILNNYNRSLKNQAVAVQNKYDKILKNRTYYNKMTVYNQWQNE